MGPCNFVVQICHFKMIISDVGYVHNVVQISAAILVTQNRVHTILSVVKHIDNIEAGSHHFCSADFLFLI